MCAKTIFYFKGDRPHSPSEMSFEILERKGVLEEQFTECHRQNTNYMTSNSYRSKHLILQSKYKGSVTYYSSINAF